MEKGTFGLEGALFGFKGALFGLIKSGGPWPLRTPQFLRACHVLWCIMILFIGSQPFFCRIFNANLKYAISMRQFIMIHCITLQSIMIHRITLQSIMIHCITLQSIMIHCITLQSIVISRKQGLLGNFGKILCRYCFWDQGYSVLENAMHSLCFLSDIIHEIYNH